MLPKIFKNWLRCYTCLERFRYERDEGGLVLPRALNRKVVHLPLVCLDQLKAIDDALSEAGAEVEYQIGLQEYDAIACLPWGQNVPQIILHSSLKKGDALVPLLSLCVSGGSIDAQLYYGTPKYQLLFAELIEWLLEQREVLDNDRKLQAIRKQHQSVDKSVWLIPRQELLNKFGEERVRPPVWETVVAACVTLIAAVYKKYQS